MTKHDILLIGDDTDLLKTIGWVLDYKGFAVKVTASPEAAGHPAGCLCDPNRRSILGQDRAIGRAKPALVGE